MKSTEYETARSAYEQAIANDPSAIPSYEGLAWLYLTRLGDYDQVIAVYERGLAANPANPRLTACLGSTYARQGKIEKALGILEQSAKDYPDQIYAPSWLSYLYFRLNRLDEAAASCRREIALKPDAHSPHRVLGLIDHVLRMNGEAVVELERAVALEPRDYEARGALAKILRAAGNLPAAETQYNTGKEMSLVDDESGLACFYAVYGDIDKALALLETACAKGQLSPGWLRIDPELYFLQDEPRFQALIS